MTVFQYNRFWHFWFQLNNQYYSRVSLVSLMISMLLIPPAIFIPPLWSLLIALPLVVAGAMILFTQLSNFFYNRQNQQLKKLKSEAIDETLKEEIDLYLNNRVICPQELLAGIHLNLPHDTPKMKRAVANTPLTLETEDILNIDKVINNILHRNSGFKATSQSNQLYVKNVAAQDGLSEISAREMAEILGFDGLIPSNTITKVNMLRTYENTESIPSADLLLSRQKIKNLIDKDNETSLEKNIKNSPDVQNAVAKFVFNLKTATYRTKAQQEAQFKLLHIQKLMPNALDGLQLCTLLFNEPVQFVLDGLTELQKKQQRMQAQNIIQKISLPSFQENFLLHLMLGSQDANPGNTLFTDAPNDVVTLHSIDHERIMPEDNYNITKKIPLVNGANPTEAIERDVKNVFPIRLWLAGLPQANVPFSKEVIEKTLESLNPERLLAYHRQKKLFSSAAVGAQLERILLIKNIFESEIKERNITLTPKKLFLKLINNHPTYSFLKNELQLSDSSTFQLLGQIPEGADMSLLRHPLQWFPMLGLAIEAAKNEQEGRPSFSEENFKSAHAHHILFFSLAKQAEIIDKANKAALDILNETAKHLSL